MTTIYIAPMMGWSYCHFRFFMRLLSPSCKIFTEMVVANTLIHGNQTSILHMHPKETPVIFQLGGGDPGTLATACSILENKGFDEINLNCGCPSAKVQQGFIGACLYKHPKRVASCLQAMREHSRLPISIKCRVGVDDIDSTQALEDFIAMCSEQGVHKVYIHARKAWLQGLNPKQNRNVPPLQYDKVYHIQKRFPDMHIVINGGIQTISHAQDHIGKTSGLMVGRAAYQRPLFIYELEQAFGETNNAKTADSILCAYAHYVAKITAKHPRSTPSFLLKPLQHFFTGTCVAKKWKQALHTLAYSCNRDGKILAHGLLEVIQRSDIQAVLTDIKRGADELTGV